MRISPHHTTQEQETSRPRDAPWMETLAVPSEVALPPSFLALPFASLAAAGDHIGFHMPVPYSLAALAADCALRGLHTPPFSTVDKRPAGSPSSPVASSPKKRDLPPSLDRVQIKRTISVSISGHIYLSTRTRYGYLLHCQTYHILSITCSGRIFCLV